MAHNLNEIDGKVAFFGTKTAWHGLGQIVTEAQTSEEAIKLAGLDYEVVKAPIQTCDGDCVEIPNYFATLRADTNTPLGVVGNRYSILQNRDAFRFVDELCGSKQAVFETAGALGKGERIFLTCKLPDRLVIGKDDVAENYFFITNSHDGTNGVELAFTNVFIVCENTLKQALRSSKRKRSVRHSGEVVSRMHDTAKLMGITRQNIEAQKEMFEAFRKVEINDAQLRRFIELALNPPKEEITEEEYSKRFINRVDKVLEYGLGDPAQLITERKGNLWGAYNTITGFYNNVETSDNKLNSIMFGNGFNKSQNALSLAYDVLVNNVNLS